jgi:hypothetical protein
LETHDNNNNNNNNNKMCKNLASLLLLSSLTVQGFLIPQHAQHSSLLPALNAAKGFGDAPKTKKPKKSSAPPPLEAPQVVKAEDTIIETGPSDSNPFPVQETSDASLGKQALERIRRERAEKRNEELSKMREVQETDALLRESPGAAVIPEKVAQRMGARMLPFVGVPLLGGMGAFVGFWYMATYRDMEYQPALVAATTIGMLAIGLVVCHNILSYAKRAEFYFLSNVPHSVFRFVAGNYLFCYERFLGRRPRRNCFGN